MNKEAFNQQHYGYGDNIAGDKIVNILGIRDLKEKLGECIKLYEKGELNNVETILKTLSETITESVLINNINIIKLYLNLDNLPQEERYERLKGCKSTDDFIKDLIISALLRYELDNKLKDIAKERFLRSNITNIYLESKKIWLQEIAELKQIEDFISENNISDLDVELQLAIVNGFLCQKDFPKAKRFLGDISLFIRCELSEELNFFIDILNFFESHLANIHFWLLNYEVKSALDNAIEKLKDWLNSEKQCKTNILNLSIIFLKYLGFQNRELCEACYKYMKDSNLNNKEYAIFQAIFENNYEDLETNEKVLAKSREDKDLRRSEVKRIQSNPVLSNKDIAFIIEHFTEEELNNYISNPLFEIEVESGDKFTKLIITNYLNILSNKFNEVKVSELTENIIRIINANSKIINPVIILKIGYEILRKRNINAASKYKSFLKDYLDRFNCWFNPLCELYTDLLLFLGQYKKLHEFLGSLNENISSVRIYELKIFLLEKENKVEESFKLAHQGVINFLYSPVLWSRYIHLCLRLNKNLNDILEKFPKDIFYEFDRDEFQLAFELACISRVDLFSENLIDRFLGNPKKYANDIAKLFFSLMLLRYIEFNVSYGKYIKIVNYSKNGKNEEKILIDLDKNNLHIDPIISNSVLFSGESDGGLLINMKEGESKSLNPFTTIKFISERKEILPFVFNLSCRISQELGINDSFGVFNIDVASENPLESIIPHLENNKNEYIVSSENPLFIKRKLLNSDFYKDVYIINNVGLTISNLNHTNKLPCSYIIDQFSLAYLFSTGLYNSYEKLDIKLYCSKRCRAALLDELNKFLAGDYMQLSFRNGKISVLSSKSLMDLELQEVKKFRDFLSKLECKEEILTDTNINLLKIKDFLPNDTFESIMLADHHKIFYLNFDNYLHDLLNNKDVGFEFSISPIHLIKKLREYSNINDILNGISLQISNKIYFPVYESDMTYILSSRNIKECNHVIFSLFKDGGFLSSLDINEQYFCCFDILHISINNLMYYRKDQEILMRRFMETISYITKINKDISFEDNLIDFFKIVIENGLDIRLINGVYNLLIIFSGGRFLDIPYLKNEISKLLSSHSIIIKEN